MAALANVLLSSLASGVLRTTDAAVGVNRTYAPEGWKQGNIASWVDRSGGIPLLYPRMTFGLRVPTKDSRIYKVSAKLFLPVAETIDPAVGIFGPRKAYEGQIHIDALIPERMTLTERQLLMALFRSYVMNTINASDDNPTDSVGSPLVNGIINLEDVY